MKTIMRSQLNGVTGWMSKKSVVRICSMKTRWHLGGHCGATALTDEDCKRTGDIPITGESLIAALRECGVETIDDVACETCNDRGKVPSGVYETPAEPCPTCKATQPALGGPDDEYARKWADENGYEVEGYRLPKKGEKYWDYRVNRLDSAHTDYQHEKAYILTPKAKPVESKPDKWAHLPEGGEWFTQTCLNPDTLWHFPTTGNTGTWYHANGLVGNTSAVGNCIYPRLPLGPYIKAISREQAIAIFEANAKTEVKPTESDQLRKELDDGGPAFPTEQGHTPEGTWNQTYAPGMSLRDYFAAKAMQGLMIALPRELAEVEAYAIDAYRFADAMLKARRAGQ